MPNPGELFELSPPHPMRGPRCPPPFELEVIAAGEAPPSTHVFDCADCGGYLRALAEEREAHNARHPVNHFVARLERARPPRRWSWTRALAFAAPLAAVAAALLLTVWSGPSHEITWKGSARLAVLALAPGAQEPREVGPGAALGAGESLRFRVTAPGDGFLAILDVDGAGNVTVFHPYGATAAAPISGGTTLLPGSIVVDDAPGPETLLAIFHPSGFELTPLIAQLRANPGAPLTCDGCTIRSVTFDKHP